MQLLASPEAPSVTLAVKDKNDGDLLIPKINVGLCGEGQPSSKSRKNSTDAKRRERFGEMQRLH